MENQKINPEEAYTTLVIIWAALFMSQLLFLVLIWLVKPRFFEFDFSKPVIDSNAPIVIILAVAAVLDLIISLVLKKRYLSRSVAEQNVGLVQTAMITGCALCESITFFGLFTVFLYEYQYFFLFFALAIIGFIFHFPRRENLIAASWKNKIT